MQNTNDWETTLAGLALVGKALAEDGGREQAAFGIVDVLEVEGVGHRLDPGLQAPTPPSSQVMTATARISRPFARRMVPISLSFSKV